MRSFSSAVVASALLAAAAGSLPPVGSARGSERAKPAFTKVGVSDKTVTIRGRVALPEDTAAQRRRTRVRLTLEDAAGELERFAARIDARRRFRATHVTELTGALTLAARVTIGGRTSGRRVTRKLTVAAPPPAPGPLEGTFRLTAGAGPAGRPPTGTYFQMLQPNGTPLENFSSPSPNKNVTPLSPGTDGGLRTDVYQPPPSPAFAGGNSGDALASRIVKPAPFFGTKFSVVTADTDPQAGVPDPLPEIRLENGRLGGQLTAWAAQWNGQSFNQGTPKPDGTRPPPTTPLSGSYDVATREFTLDWKSLIVGGPFNGFTGVWHLEGTFVPAG